MELRVSARQGRRSQKLKEAHLLLRCSLWQVEFPGEPHQCTSLSQARLTSLMLLQKVGAVFRTNDKCECRICIFRHSFIHSYFILCFPESSVGKESACRETLVRFLGSEDPLEKGQTGYPLQCSWAFLVAQLVKNPPATWETCVRSLGWEDPLEKGKATHSSILAWRIPWTVESTGSQRVRYN